jgi:hypothetical protein
MVLRAIDGFVNIKDHSAKPLESIAALESQSLLEPQHSLAFSDAEFSVVALWHLGFIGSWVDDGGVKGRWLHRSQGRDRNRRLPRDSSHWWSL